MCIRFKQIACIFVINLVKYKFYLSFELILAGFEFSKYFGLNGLDK